MAQSESVPKTTLFETIKANPYITRKIRVLSNALVLMMFKLNFFIISIVLLLLGCESTKVESIFSWVDEKDAAKVERWLTDGGDPNLKYEDGASLLYIATGPHGGNSVLRLLLKHGASVNEGKGKYTPLMNAASWVNEEAVTMLIEFGANANLRNERGQLAIDVIGNNGNDKDQQRIREALAKAMRR